MITTKLKPKNGNVIIKWLKDEAETTSFGFVIPDSKKYGDFALVLAVCKDSLLTVGDKVIFNKSAGSFVKDGLEELLIIKESEIYGIVE